MINCKFENGNKANLRHVTVKALTINDRNEVLLVRRSPKIIGGGKYDIPGGFLEHGEDTKEGGLRELFEEAGIRGEIQFLLRINDNPKRPKEDRQNVDFIYIVKSTTGELKVDHESTGAGWFSEANLPPEEDFAFDHKDSILKYFKYLKEPFKLPIIG